MEISEKSGKTFIAYYGSEFSKSAVEGVLNELCPYGYTVKSRTCDNVVFSKIILNKYTDDRDPYWNSQSRILSVNGYNQEEIYDANNLFDEYGITDPDMLHRLTNYLYRDLREAVFMRLKDYMHFCSVFWDDNKESLVAGVTTPNDNPHTHLYYGYTKSNHELMFSNNEVVLTQFCDTIHEMPKNTYMKNGDLYTLDGTIIEDNSNPTLIKKDKATVDALISGLNALLIQVTNEAAKEQIERNVDEYLNSRDSKKRIDEFLLKNLDTETKKLALQLIKKVLEKNNIEEKIEHQVQDIVDKKVSEYKNTIQVPIVHIIKLNDTILGRTEGGFYHEKFEEVLSYVQLDEPIMLIGPAGSGKNYAIGQIAQALGLHMYYTNNASNEFKLTGFIDAGGNYRDTEFYKAFKNGGVFFLDEIDNSDPSALIVINSALANGYMAFPHETIDRHPNFRMVAAANTWGKGSDLQYVGRNALDGATLDRFDNVFFDYDRKLEAKLYPNDKILEFMWSFRDATESTKIPHIVSTRGIGKVYKKEINGIPVEAILRTNVVRNLGRDDLNTLLGSMRNIAEDNKFFVAAKTLKLSR